MTRAVLAQNFLDWIAQSVGVATVLWSRSLAGGTHALTDVVTLPSGEELVLRRFPIGDDAVHRETHVLTALQGLDGLAPAFLASDPDGLTGVPTILTTLVDGSACITPDDPLDFASQLGETLARIHGHPTTPDLPDVLGAAKQNRTLMGRWGRIFEAPPVLTHNDFWSGNTLWRDGRLTGVVDWSGGGVAPRGFDLSWARLDLILLFDQAVADAFTSAYESASRATVPDIDLWDLFAASNAHPNIESWAPNYQEIGRADLGPAALRQRLTAWESIARSSSKLRQGLD